MQSLDLNQQQSHYECDALPLSYIACMPPMWDTIVSASGGNRTRTSDLASRQATTTLQTQKIC